MGKERSAITEDGAIELGDEELEIVTAGGMLGAFLSMGSPGPGARDGDGDRSALPLRRRPGEP